MEKNKFSPTYEVSDCPGHQTTQGEPGQVIEHNCLHGGSVQLTLGKLGHVWERSLCTCSKEKNCPIRPHRP